MKYKYEAASYMADQELSATPSEVIGQTIFQV